METETPREKTNGRGSAGTSLVATEQGLTRRGDQSLARQVLYQTTVPYWRSPEGMFDDVQRVLDQIRFTAVQRDFKVVGVTASRPGEGTSTVASLLALMSAVQRNGGPADESVDVDLDRLTDGQDPSSNGSASTLLVDAQVRHPTLHRLFGKPAKPGLLDLLDDPESLGLGLREGPQLGLKLVTAGTANGGLLPRLDVARFSSLLDILRQRFGLILVDLPPVLRYPEGAALSRACDAVVMVVRAGRTRYEVVREARHRLEGAGVRILGSVLNQRRFYIPSFIYRRL